MGGQLDGMILNYFGEHEINYKIINDILPPVNSVRIFIHQPIDMQIILVDI